MLNKLFWIMVVVCFGITALMVIDNIVDRGRFVFGGECLIVLLPIAVKLIVRQIQLVVYEVIKN